MWNRILSLLIALAVSLLGMLGIVLPGSRSPLCDPAQLTVSNGNRIMLEQGFVLQAWVPSEDSGERCIPADTLKELGFGPTYYGENMFNTPLHQEGPDLIWSIAKAPNNVNAVGGLPTGEEWLTAEQQAYAETLIAACFGDEQGYSSEQAKVLAQWYADMRTRHPDVLLHSNQYAGQWSRAQYKEYMRVAKPDMLTMDSYYFDRIGSIRDCDVGKVVADAINTVRLPAIAGYDGSGREPIPFGQYLLGYKTGENSAGTGEYEITQSQKNLVANLTVTMGGKWLNLFRIIYAPSMFLLFDENGQPTRHFEEYAAINKQIMTLSDQLVKLQTTDVQVVPGEHMLWKFPLANGLPKTVNPFCANKDFHLADIAVKNEGAQNNGLPGDVYIGYFATLPGVTFESGKARQYFIVCSALTSGNGLLPAEQHGSAAETAQTITLTAADVPVGKTLYAVSGETGAGSAVSLANNTHSFTLGGGEMQVFYWE